METALFIIGFVQFVVLIMFFQLTGDIRDLRVKFNSKNPKVWLDRYYKYRCLKRDDEALKSLQEYIWLKLNKSNSNYNELYNTWKDQFHTLNAEFPHRKE